MFDHPNEPQHLIDSLIAFVDSWQGIRPWYGVAADKLNAVNLPRPLAQLYGSLGNMPGTKQCPFPFATQDQLLPFEFVRLQDSRLLFAFENQGCWRAFTETSGDDPSVWFAADDDEPVLEHPSLANFLVTLCLQELTMGCPILYAGQELIRKLDAGGHRVNPLWLDGLFPGYDQLLNPKFYLVDGRSLLFRDAWIGFQTPDESEMYSDALTGANRVHPPETPSMAEYLSRPDRNPIAERIYYERQARDYQAQADALQAKADECVRAANRV